MRQIQTVLNHAEYALITKENKRQVFQTISSDLKMIWIK